MTCDSFEPATILLFVKNTASRVSWRDREVGDGRVHVHLIDMYGTILLVGDVVTLTLTICIPD